MGQVNGWYYDPHIVREKLLEKYCQWFGARRFLMISYWHCLFAAPIRIGKVKMRCEGGRIFLKRRRSKALLWAIKREVQFEYITESHRLHVFICLDKNWQERQKKWWKPRFRPIPYRVLKRLHSGAHKRRHPRG